MSITISDPTEGTASILQSSGDLDLGLEVSTTSADAGYDEANSLGAVKVTDSRHVTKPQRSKNPLRRLHGFLIETQGEDSKVALEENGEIVEYYFPSALLRASHVTLKNQPFELDEFLDGPTLVLEIRPLAGKEHASTSAIQLDEERRRKMDLILSEDAKG